MKLTEWLGEENQIGQDIWYHKYQYNDESFDEWLDRVSNGDEEVLEEIKAKRFLFGGRILANRGLYKDGIKVTYSNCYVIPPPEDNIESIYDTASKLARTFSYGGGCGIDISNLAPRGAKVNNTAKTTSGAVSFMDLYAMTTELIGQNGRRGALMLSLDCHHPDLEEFINVKSDLDKVTTANISVRVTDDFMNAAIHNQPFELKHWRDEVNAGILKEINANEVLDKLAFQNWDMGEPGMLFWDTIQNWNIVSEDSLFSYAGVNPCAEEPLPAGGSCLLGSINLSEFVNDPYTDHATFDKEQFIKTVKISVNALNDVLDEGLSLHPLQIQRDTVRDWRQIGLGIFGLADMLIKLGVKYGSEQSLMICEDIGKTMARTAIMQSCELAKKYDMYPACDTDEVVKSPFVKYLLSEDELKEVEKFGLRNSQLLTIAPTGTLSTMCQVSGGVEPYFAKSWVRTTKSLHGEDVDYVERPKTLTELLEHIHGENDNDFPDYVITSSEIEPINRIHMQATWQRNIDASISSTVNLPNSATVDEVKQIYIQAWKNGLKGITVFRDGCRRVGILNTENSNEDSAKAVDKSTLQRGDIIIADDDVVGKKRKLTTGCGSLHCTAFFDPITGDLCETYLSRGSTGGCANNMTAMSRMISLASRAGVDIDTIIDQLNSCGVCPSYAVRTATKHDTSKGSCCPIAVGYALKDMWREMRQDLGLDEMSEDIPKPKTLADIPPSGCPECDEDVREVVERFQLTKKEQEDLAKEYKEFKSKSEKAKCPECGEDLVFEGGCRICKSCGFSYCD